MVRPTIASKGKRSDIKWQNDGTRLTTVIFQAAVGIPSTLEVFNCLADQGRFWEQCRLRKLPHGRGLK